MSFDVEDTKLPEVKLIKPKVFQDDRGFFVPSFNELRFKDITGFTGEFVQDNHSRSTKGVLRGMHWQLHPHAQGKLVRVARGAVFDAAVDARQNSPHFGQWVGYVLDDVSHHQLWVPPGFAHGFLVLSDIADFLYKVTASYAPELEGSFAWNDPAIGIEWPFAKHGITDPVLSGKDQKSPLLKDANIFKE